VGFKEQGHAARALLFFHYHTQAVMIFAQLLHLMMLLSGVVQSPLAV